jgi:hypothetical protein
MSPTSVKVGWQAGPTERGTLTLLYSCLITIFACTWTVLHLNVPGINEGFWTKALRKTKWMAITVLFPEFIFSKAICELRLALHDLHKLHDALKDRYEDGLQWSVSDSDGEHKQVWSWEVPYGPSLRRLSWLLGLPRPSNAQKPGADKTGKSEIRNTTAVISPVKGHMDCDHPGTKRNRDLQASRQSGIDEVGKVEIEEGDAIGIEQALLSPKLCAISTGEDAQEKIDQAQKVQNKDAPGERTVEYELPKWQVSAGGDPTSELDSTNLITGLDEHRDGAQRQQNIRVYHSRQCWTLTHSYFANMGGLVFLDLSKSRDWRLQYLTLTASRIGSGYFIPPSGDATFHVLKGLVLDEKDIEDQSKADVLLRTLAVLQITWIILTVLVRGVTGLPLTQLEIATLAFSIFAILTYAANWWKPKDVSRPIRLQFRVRSWSYDNTQSFILRLKAPAKAAETAKNISDMARVPNDLIWMEENVPLIFSIMAMSALVFGGLHCLAWNFEFPSHAELILWRTASLTSAILPLLSVAFSLYLTYLATTYAENKLVSFLMANLPVWNQFPSEYWKSMQNPTFETKTSETNPNSRGPLDNFCSEIKEFIEIWEEVNQKGTLDPPMLKRLEIPFSMAKYYYSSIEALNLWNSFEDSLRSQYRASGTTIPKRFVALLMEVIERYEIEKKKETKRREACNEASQFFMISIGIVYVASRLIIIVLLFTCLRAVPEGVYENTPWTRFLPNFS